MRRRILLAALLVVATPPLAAQSDSGRVWLVGQWRAHEGHEARFSQAIDEYSRPVFAWLVENDDIVSYLHLELADIREAGDGEPTHLLIIELPSWEARDNWAARFEEARWAVFGESVGDWYLHFQPHRQELSFANPWISTAP
jgi:hypothetical protein